MAPPSLSVSRLVAVLLLVFCVGAGYLVAGWWSGSRDTTPLARICGRVDYINVIDGGSQSRDDPAGDHGPHPGLWLPGAARLLQFRSMPSQRNPERRLAAGRNPGTVGCVGGNCTQKQNRAVSMSPASVFRGGTVSYREFPLSA
jgi:hypothetical protein